jgi:hypothetical protein
LRAPDQSPTGWCATKFVRDTRNNRILKSDNLGTAVFTIRADVRTNEIQVAEAVACSGDRRWRFDR